jgi:hypothetical protein
MNNYAFDFYVPFNIINQNFDYKNITTPHSKQLIPTSLSLEFINFVDSLGFKIVSVELFIRRPNTNFDTIHIDDHDVHDRARINCVLESVNSVMGFFKPKNENCGYLTTGAVGGQPKRYNLDEVDLVHQHVITSASVIQTGVPHGVLNPYSKRYSIAMHFVDKRTNSIVTFNDARQAFEKYIII